MKSTTNYLQLVSPDINYKETFLSAISEFRNLTSKQSQDEKYADMNENMSDNEFAEYVKNLETRANTSDPEKGLSRRITYWLVDNNGWIGSIRIRPYLSKEQAEWYGHIGYEIRPSKRKMGYAWKMLQMALQKCSEIELRQVCIVCSLNNIPSRRMIENVFEKFGGSKAFINGDDYYHWINTSKN